jgi:hypothetical protein
MKNIIIIFLFFVNITTFCAQNDTLYLKRRDPHQANYPFKTDTIIIESYARKNFLFGTTVLPWTDNQMEAKNFGLDFDKVKISECKNDRPPFGPEKINTIKVTDSLIIIDINLVGNCCNSFLCDIQIKNNTTLNLIYYGYGNNCSCTCCFGLTYMIHKDNFEEFNKQFKKLKNVIINGDIKTSRPLK